MIADLSEIGHTAKHLRIGVTRAESERKNAYRLNVRLSGMLPISKIERLFRKFVVTLARAR